MDQARVKPPTPAQNSTTRHAGCRHLTSYSFRYRHAKGMHTSNAPIANISEAMGHTIEVHLKSYARFKPNATAIIIAAVSVSLPDPSDRGSCSRNKHLKKSFKLWRTTWQKQVD